MEPYKLVSSLHAHDGPIRSLCIGPNGEIISGCQSDSPNFRRWSTSDFSFEEQGSSVQHDHWVTALTALEQDISRPYYQEGCIISGCQDSNIRIFDNNGTQLQVLTGHSKGVISFSWTTNGNLVSGSWDGTARIWDLLTSTCVMQLGPHENGVKVLGLPNNQVATTSTGESVNGKPANFKLRIWDATTGLQIGNAIEGDHSASIRSIAALPGIDGFMTTGNDGSVVMRSIEGYPIDSMFHKSAEDGSPVFVFDSCALHTDGDMDIVSCGEDGSVMVWRGTELVQSIPHPCSVWTVLSLPSTKGDFVTAGNDGVLRMFSRDSAKMTALVASHEHWQDQLDQMNAAFLLEVKEAQRSKQRGPSNEELAKAMPWQQRGSQPGKSEGQVMVFNKDGSMIAAQWLSGSWVIVGEVTGSGDGGYIQEVWYDHVMPVEIETPRGVMSLKLGHNNGENPFVAAQRFIDQHQLEQGYLSQIADWITARAGQTMPTLGSSSDGGDRGESSRPQASAVAAFSYKIQSFTTYDDVPAMNKIVAKINEFNTATAATTTTLTERELASIDQIAQVLFDTSHYHSSVITTTQLQHALLKPISNWSSAQLFPIFDLLRVVAIHPSGATSLAMIPMHQLTHFVENILALVSQSESTYAATPFATTLTACRFLCNLFKIDTLRTVVLIMMNNHISSGDVIYRILTSILTQVNHSNKLVRITVSRIVMNIAACSNSTPPFASFHLTPQAVSQLIEVIVAILTNEQENQEEVLFDTLKALGTIIHNSKSLPVSPVSAEQLEKLRLIVLSSPVNTLQNNREQVTVGCLQEVLQLLNC